MSTALVIGVLNPKGGCGKSTLATNLARGMQLEELRTVLIDTDPQQTAWRWYTSQDDSGELPRVVKVDDHKVLDREISELSGSYEVVIIDGSAKTKGMTGASVRASDVVIIPVQPTSADVWGAGDLVDIIYKLGNPGKSAFVISRQIVGTNLADAIGAGLSGYDLKVFDGRTSQRVAYPEAMGHGSTVLDDQPTGKAAAEIRAIMNDLLELING